MKRGEQINEQAKITANQYSHPVDWNIAYCSYVKGAIWSDSNPGWQQIKDELPPKDPEIKSQTLSIPVLVTDGKICQVCRYDFISNSWAIQNIEITHWTKLPILPKKEN